MAKFSLRRKAVATASNPREILTDSRQQALTEIEAHQEVVKNARAAVDREQKQIDTKTKLVKDIDVALGVID